MQSAIGRLRARGSSHTGLHHWKAQRVTAVSNLLLVLWFLFNAISMAGADYAEWVAWFQSPLNASLMVMLVLSVFYHAKMGVQVMIEDYVHSEGLKVVGLVGVTLLAAALATACIVSILMLATGG